LYATLLGKFLRRTFVYLTQFARNHLYRHLRDGVINICMNESTAHVTKLSKKISSCVEHCSTFPCPHSAYNFSLFWSTSIPSTPYKPIPLRSNLKFYSALTLGSWGASLLWVLNFTIFDAPPNLVYRFCYVSIRHLWKKNSLMYVNTHCLWLPACAVVRMGQNGVVSIATCYRLIDPGIESRWFSATVQTRPAAHPVSYIMDTGSLPGVKWLGRKLNTHPNIRPRLKKE